MKPNTKLTDIEVRWLRRIYRKKDAIRGKAMGHRKLTDSINEGRKKAGCETVSTGAVLRVLKKIETGATIVPSNVAINRTVKCPKCGHTFEVKK